MIRRWTTCPDGTAGIILITQVAHAHLAADVARHWHLPPGDPLLSVRDEWLQAIDHHDDGWIPWERRPKLDPATGLPQNFTEMPLAESLPIWRRSIELVCQIGPLAAHMVAGHFLYLIEHSAASCRVENAVLAAAWVDEFRQRQDEWCEAWREIDPGASQQEVVALALDSLQAFDALSLWLCCGCQGDRHLLQQSAGPDIELRTADPGRIEVQPWPFETPEVQLRAEARLLAAAVVTDQDGVDMTAGQPLSLEWHLCPAPLD